MAKGLGKRQEPKIALSHNDSLTFAQKSRKGLFFIGAILLALVITGGVFAWGATTTTVTLTVTEKPDFATVTAGAGPTWNAFGSFKGSVGQATLFTIAPDAAWSGDMSVVVTLANAQDLVEAYRILVLEIEVWNNADVSIGTTEYLTLGVGEISIDFTQATAGPYTVEVTGGYYITHKAGAWSADPVIMCQVLQRSS